MCRLTAKWNTALTDWPNPQMKTMLQRQIDATNGQIAILEGQT
jgi:hypothetical protein